MGIEALTLGPEGQTIVPVAAHDWDDWVSASSTRNYVLDDPLLDWLEGHGEAKGFERDTDFDERTDFLTFLFRKGWEFEAAVVEHCSDGVRVASCTKTSRMGGRDRSAHVGRYPVSPGRPKLFRSIARSGQEEGGPGAGTAGRSG